MNHKLKLSPNRLSKALIAFSYLLGSSAVQGISIERSVEFRDGSTLNIELPPLDLIFNKCGQNEAENAIKIPLHDALQITFSEIPPLRRIESITKALKGLRNESFAMREQAALTLTKFGTGFRGLLEDKLAASFDPEIKWRLRRVLEQLPFYASDEYDHVRLGETSFKGEFEDWQLDLNYRGVAICLNRKTVRSISTPASYQGSKIQVVRDSTGGRVPLGCRKIDFERLPSGEALMAGDNIQQAFIDWGISFATSIENSFVSVNRYHIEGSGGGKSVATHDPLYEGAITINFCQPHDPTRPAGVQFIGCWLGIVKPGGTFMIAYDSDGAEIGRAISADGKGQFLGIKSKVKIARVEIVPNPDIDSNFALDDIIYEQPAPLIGALNSTHFSVTLVGGNKINCRSIKAMKNLIAQDACIVVKPASRFAEEITIPLRQVKQIVPPVRTRIPNEQLPRGTWAKLADGSQVRLHSPGKDALKSVVGNLEANQLEICSLWASRRALQMPPNDLRIPKGGAAIIIRDEPLYLKSYKLGNAKFSGLRHDGSTINYSYNRLPSVWIRTTELETQAQGRIDLTDGQILYFGKQCLLKSCELEDNRVSARFHDTGTSKSKSINLGLESIRAVNFY